MPGVRCSSFMCPSPAPLWLCSAAPAGPAAESVPDAAVPAGCRALRPSRQTSSEDRPWASRRVTTGRCCSGSSAGPSPSWRRVSEASASSSGERGQDRGLPSGVQLGGHWSFRPRNYSGSTAGPESSAGLSDDHGTVRASRTPRLRPILARIASIQAAADWRHPRRRADVLGEGARLLWSRKPYTGVVTRPGVIV
jgi:hypothetical protein